MRIYTANARGLSSNCLYPNQCLITDEASFRRAVENDYVCAEYKGNYRSSDNFIRSDVLPMDNDNTHSDEPENWITVEDIKQLFPDVSFYIHYSRNHMKEKDDRPARPRYHVLFSINECTSVEVYTELKSKVYNMFPFFDGKALDAARFFYGTEKPEIVYCEGTKTLDEFLAEEEESVRSFSDLPQNKISEGSRNATMSRAAGKILKRLGNTEEAYDRFLERAKSCDPPLDDGELATIWHSALKFYNKISRAENYIPPEEYHAEAGTLRPKHMTDVDEACILAERYKDRLRHSPATRFLVYDGKTWVESDANARALVHDLTEAQLEEHDPVYLAARKALEEAEKNLLQAKAYITASTDETVKADLKAIKDTTAGILAQAEKVFKAEEAYHKFLLNCRNSGKITGILEESKSFLQVDVSDLDNKQFLLNTPAGEVDLKTGTILPHDPLNYHTHITKASPDHANEKIWQDFLDVITCGDKELEHYLQLTSGEELIGRIHNESMRIQFGGGSNGKSTYTNTKLRILGSYGGQITAESLTTNNKNNKNWEIAELRGKRLIVAGELEEGTRLNDAFIKKICSTDPIVGEKKHKDPFTFLPSHTVVLYTNHLPKVGSLDKGTWRRLTVIPFRAEITPDNDIKNYTEYLVENCSGAVLQWMIDGARMFVEAGCRYTEPECVRIAKEEYRSDSDWLTHFLEECCEIDKKNSCKSGELYQEYRRYADSIGEYRRSPQDFVKALKQENYTIHKMRQGSIVYGLAMKPHDDFLN